MRFVSRFLLAAIALLGGLPAVALGDGGAVRLMEQQGGLRLAVFTSPTPLRAGPADVSVLLLHAETGQLVDQAEVTLTLTCRDAPEATLRASATTKAATNKLLRAAPVDLPCAGWWDVEVSFAAAGESGQAHFSMVAGPPLPHWLIVWPWFTWPIGAIALFGIHRALVFRAKAAKAGS